MAAQGKKLRVETPEGVTIETALERLRRYIESQRSGWNGRRTADGKSFDEWSEEVVRGALKNLASSVILVHPGSQ